MGKQHAGLRIIHSCYSHPIHTADCSLSFTVGGGLVSSANPCVPTPVVVRPRWSVPFQEGKELATVLVQIVTDRL